MKQLVEEIPGANAVGGLAPDIGRVDPAVHRQASGAQPLPDNPGVVQVKSTSHDPFDHQYHLRRHSWAYRNERRDLLWAADRIYGHAPFRGNGNYVDSAGAIFGV